MQYPICQQVLDLYKKIGDPLGQGNSFKNIGNIYKDTRKFNDALNNYQQALALYKSYW